MKLGNYPNFYTSSAKQDLEIWQWVWEMGNRTVWLPVKKPNKPMIYRKLIFQQSNLTKCMFHIQSNQIGKFSLWAIEGLGMSTETESTCFASLSPLVQIPSVPYVLSTVLKNSVWAWNLFHLWFPVPQKVPATPYPGVCKSYN